MLVDALRDVFALRRKGDFEQETGIDFMLFCAAQNEIRVGTSMAAVFAFV